GARAREAGHRRRWHRGARRGPSRLRAGARARARPRAEPLRGLRPAGRHHPDGAARRLPRGMRRRLVSLREALGARALSADRGRGQARPHRRSLPACLRRLPGPPASAARGLPAPRAHALRPLSPLPPLLLAGQAPHGPRPRAAARSRSRPEPGGLREAAAGPPGPGAGGPAARGRDLHGGSRSALARGNNAEVSRAGAARAEFDPGPLARGAPGARGESRGERRALVALRHLRRGHGRAGPRSPVVDPPGRRPSRGSGDSGDSRGRPFIACTFSSVKYPGRAPEGGALLRVFLGGAMNEGVLEGDDETLARLARGELAELLGVRVPPLWTRVGRYPRAMPQYQIGHLALVAEIEGCVRELSGLVLIGGALSGIGCTTCGM